MTSNNLDGLVANGRMVQKNKMSGWKSELNMYMKTVKIIKGIGRIEKVNDMDSYLA